MAREWRMAAMAVGLAGTIMAGCETPLGPAELTFEPLKGEWVACLNDGAGDYARRIYFYPDSFTSTTRTYATADGTCGGGETAVSSEIWRYGLLQDVTARVPGAASEVVAKEMNIANSFETLYTIVYVDELTTPPVLYFGDLAADPALDGTAPDRRPAVLSAATALTSR